MSIIKNLIEIKKHHTCGSVCLSLVLNYFDREYDDALDMDLFWMTDIATMAENKGLDTNIYTYSERIFGQDLFNCSEEELIEKLKKKRKATTDQKLSEGLSSIVEYMQVSGNINFKILSPRGIERKLDRGNPLITAVKSSILNGEKMEGGHFIILNGIESNSYKILNPKRNSINSEKLSQEKFIFSFYNWGAWCLEINN